MTLPGDDDFRMTTSGLLDDETIEAIVAGDEVDTRFGEFAALAESIRTLGNEPLPPVSPALEAVFADPDQRRVVPLGRRRLRAVAAKVAAMGVVAKIGLGTSAAAAGVMVAGAGGALPDPATKEIRGVIEAVSPIEFGETGDPDAPGGGDSPGNFGDRVSRDATGESDGDPGVDGRDISEGAPGASHRPDQPGQPGQDRAEEAPAAPHVPGEPGAGEAPGAVAPGACDDGSGGPPTDSVPSPPECAGSEPGSTPPPANGGSAGERGPDAD